MRIVLSLVMLLAVVLPSAADTVRLVSGGKVAGTVDEIVFFQEGAKKTFGRGEFVAVCLGKKTPDIIQLNGGGSGKGELVSLQIKSIGGLLTFTRAQVASVDINRVPLDDVRKQYLLKKSQADPKDAGALYKLAVWCKANGLKAEAFDLARGCLEAGPSEELAVLAHRLLGHVLHNDQWVEPGKLKPRIPDKPKTSQPEPETGPVTVDPARFKLCKDLAKEYAEKAEEARKKDGATVRDTYEEAWAAACRNVRKLKKDSEECARKRADNRKEYTRLRRAGYSSQPKTLEEERRKEQADELRKTIDDSKRRQRKLDSDHEKAVKERLKIGRKVKGAKAKTSSRARERRQKLLAAEMRIERLVRLGKKFSEDEMRAVFDAALGD